LRAAALKMGANAEFWYGHGTVHAPKFVETRALWDRGELAKMAEKCKGFDADSQLRRNSDFTVEKIEREDFVGKSA
jgi:hypothetical protein